jgi:hypothetical protein
MSASRPSRHPLPRIPSDERSRSADSPTASSNAFCSPGIRFRHCRPVDRPDGALRNPWNRHPCLFGKGNETTALRYQARPSRRQQYRKSMASISERYRGSSPGARTNCYEGWFMCKRADGYHVDHPVVRGQRHDQGTFGAQLRFTDSPGKGRRVRCHTPLRTASVAIADRQDAASLPAHLVLHAIELKGYATGEGLLSTLQDRRLTA